MCIYGRPIYTTCGHPGALHLQQLCSGAGYDRLTSAYHGMALTEILATVGNPCNITTIDHNPFKAIDGACDGCQHVAAQGQPVTLNGLEQAVSQDNNNISSAWLSSPFQGSSPYDRLQQSPAVAESPLERQRRRPHLTRDDELGRVGNRRDVARAQRLADENRALDEEFRNSTMKTIEERLLERNGLAKAPEEDVDQHDDQLKVETWDPKIGSSDYWETEEEKEAKERRERMFDKTFS